eukprot:4946975-Amphidinium_carterae.1
MCAFFDSVTFRQEEWLNGPLTRLDAAEIDSSVEDDQSWLHDVLDLKAFHRAQEYPCWVA